LSRFRVHTDILARDLDPFGFSSSVPKMLNEANLTSILFRQAYICPLAICHCAKDRKVMVELDGPDENAVRAALSKIGLPATAIVPKAS